MNTLTENLQLMKKMKTSELCKFALRMHERAIYDERTKEILNYIYSIFEERRIGAVLENEQRIWKMVNK